MQNKTRNWLQLACDGVVLGKLWRKKAFHVFCSNQEIDSIHTVRGKVTQMIKKGSAHNAGDLGPVPVWKHPWRRKWQCIPLFLLGESHGQRSLAGYSPWGHKESDTNN